MSPVSWKTFQPIVSPSNIFFSLLSVATEALVWLAPEDVLNQHCGDFRFQHRQLIGTQKGIKVSVISPINPEKRGKLSVNVESCSYHKNVIMVRQTLIWVNQCILVLVVTVMLNLHLHNFRNFWDIWREREVSLICSTERRDQEDKADVGTDSITGESDDAKREAEQAVLGQKAEPGQGIEMGKATEDEEIDIYFKSG